MRRISLALLIVVLFVFSAGAFEIKNETVDEGSHQGRNSSMAFDNEGNIHVSFLGEYDQSVKYAFFDGEEWVVEKIFESYDSVKQTSLALKPDGKPSIAFSTYAWPEGSIFYASFNGTDWDISSVDRGEYGTGEDLSLAFDSNGNPAIAYIKDTDSYPEYDLKYAVLQNGSWVSDTVCLGDNIATSCTLVFNSEGIPHISYAHRTGGVKYEYYWLDSEDIWQQESVDPEALYPAGFTESMALDSLGRPHFVYNDNNAGLLKYAFPDGDIRMEIVTEPWNHSYSSIAIDGNDNVHVVYCGYDGSDSGLKYAFYDGESWDITVADPHEDSGSYPSLVLNLEGEPCISYYNSSSYDLKYATQNGESWDIQTVPPAGISRGQYPDIELDSQGNPHMVYMIHGDRAIKYASKIGEDWNISDLVSFEELPSGNYFRSPSLAMNDEDVPEVVFASNDVLTYATMLNDTWQFEAISPDLDTTECDLALEISGKSHIAFTAYNYASSNGSYGRDLYYVTKIGSGLSVEKIDEGEIYRNNIALDQNGNASILYYDNFSHELRYASQTDGDWDINAVASIDYYYGLSHAVDSEGIAHIAFVDRPQPLHDAGSASYSGELIHGTLLDGEWITEKIDDIENVHGVRQISLALDPFDNPHIAYGTSSVEFVSGGILEEDEKADLKYAWFDGDSWNTGILAKGYTNSFAMYSSLELDDQGLPHVAYFTGTGVDYLTLVPEKEDYLGNGGTCSLGLVSPALGLLLLPLVLLFRSK